MQPQLQISVEEKLNVVNLFEKKKGEFIANVCCTLGLFTLPEISIEITI